MERRSSRPRLLTGGFLEGENGDFAPEFEPQHADANFTRMVAPKVRGSPMKESSWLLNPGLATPWNGASKATWK